MWTQVVGKIALARAAPMNHCWAIAFHFTSRGLHTGLLSHEGPRSARPHVHDRLRLHLSPTGDRDLRRGAPHAALAPRSVAEFYVRGDRHVGTDVVCRLIWPCRWRFHRAGPIELDTARHASTPRVRGTLIGESSSGCTRSLTACRSGSSATPVHILLGRLDLAITGYGRHGARGKARRSCAERVPGRGDRHGCWPGGGPCSSRPSTLSPSRSRRASSGSG